MDLKLLEDFTTLVSVRNFSRAARQRNITQSAFSRRIKALEAWVGVELIDRNASPFGLTRAGEQFRNAAARVALDLYDARNAVRESHANGDYVVSFASLHNLALTFFPCWMAAIEREVGELPSRLIADNRTISEYIIALQEHNCDFMLCYESSEIFVWFQDDALLSVKVGTERIVPVTRVDPDGKPYFDLTRGSKVPLLDYSGMSFLGQLLPMMYDRWKIRSQLVPVYENAMSGGLKAMLMQKPAVAWLPLSSVEKELSQGTLALAGPPELGIDLNIQLYRSASNRRPVADRIWTFASEHTG
jgi:DNA-binding transcriptional LysR family regulator